MNDDAPERIWAYPFTGRLGEGKWHSFNPEAYVGDCPEYIRADRIEALDAELQRARSEARHAIADAYRMGQEAQSAAIDAALAELDASLFTNAEHHRAKDILRAAREATK